MVLSRYYDETGKIRGDFFAAFELTEILLSLFEFPVSVSEYDAREIVEKVKRFNLAGKASKILTAMQRELESLRHQPEMKFIVMSGMSLPKGIDLKNRRYNGAVISFGLPITNPVNKVLSNSVATIYRAAKTEFPCTSLQPVKVFVSARSHAEAFERGERALKLLRAVWTLVGSYKTMSMSFESSPIALGPVILGPAYSLHQRDGALATQLVSREIFFTMKRSTSFSSGAWNKILSQETRVRRRVSLLKYSEQFENLLIGYADALDFPSYNVVALHLWGVLEKLAGASASNKVPGSQIVSRVAALSQRENQFRAERIILQRCYNYRNDWAHHAKSDQRAWWVANKLKAYVELLLSTALWHGPRFASLESFGDYLDKCAQSFETKRNNGTA